MTKTSTSEKCYLNIKTKNLIHGYRYQDSDAGVSALDMIKSQFGMTYLLLTNFSR